MVKDWKFDKFYKVIIFVNCIVPLTLMLWDVYQKRAGANPVEFVTRTTGMLTLLFLLISLAVTPLRKWTSIQWLIRFRRMLGLYAFFYGFLHLLTYVWFDRSWRLGTVVPDILQRPFIAVGMLSFFIMVPLAITSTDKMLKRLGGKRWQKLHKTVYLSAIGGVLHYYLLVKKDTGLPLALGFVLLILLGYRIFNAYMNQKVLSPVPPRSKG
ncbi:MAG TPA: protein-methionine-sulfoxide reductase heme-binding subunit MsrQ [Pyrinomonadaceae bacterium]|jgi:sulfoxide reductase heme-binding subunit YedZ